jgi:coenzyme PQQ precursor peptide PqqA
VRKAGPGMATWSTPDFEVIDTSLELTAYLFATR